ncbi:unnamed protein product [Eruca vesicaria subsp. sativa]|uniref:Uncharacterized protein n=1 Tax=Eruca vesicaria subsp. sativa TaxID=29727 RepID=A0ABC8JGP6_ERUVS|nr:unnamed protein product [Eruca vesicaria subsp. sativa]
MDHVALYGPKNWNYIVEKMQGRTGKSCRLRWFNKLDSALRKKRGYLQLTEHLKRQCFKESLACAHGKKVEAAINESSYNPTSDHKASLSLLVL